MTPTNIRKEAPVRKLPLHQIYVFGKSLSPLAGLTRDSKVHANIVPLWEARTALATMLGDESPLLDTARRASVKLVAAIDKVLPRDFQAVMQIPSEQEIGWEGAGSISGALTDLESVLGNDMAGIAAYLVSKKGIFDTEALITHGERHLVPDVLKALPLSAALELQEAGKCLAYEVPTACAFHLWRAVEIVADIYYKALTTQSFADAKINRNWYAYIQALQAAKADKRVTTFLDHIRSEYRNPTMHPTELVELNEAQALFNVATSSIHQMIGEMKKAPVMGLLPSPISGGAAAGNP